MRVPRVMNYTDALEIYNKVKPLRGRSPEVRPLGERRDVDTYQIRKNDEAIELVLYKTPVITFMPDGEVVLFTNGYDTVSTHQFIHRVLGIGASGVRNKTLLTINGNKLVLGNGEKLRLKLEGGNWHPLNASTQYGWRLNRKAVTNVRNIYADFYKYLKGFVNLRTEKAKPSYWSPEKDCIVVPLEEFRNACGSLLHVREYCYMDKRGAQQAINYQAVKPEQYRESAIMFENLIAPDQDESVRHSNFYKAALILIAKTDSDTMDMRADETIVQASHVVPTLDTVLFQFYADDVLVREAMPQGKVSSGKYDKWMVEW